ncbi:MAG: hypothetical protein QOF76_5270 [Solirubrobacteraceae bacterium]|jgi:enoyl-CoA hydratase|nr:hypothetical protein [Solirubrobacteraceae bacterium]
MADGGVVETRREGAVLEIELRRPPANALGLPLVDGLSRAAAELLAPDVKVAVICSEVPGFFAAGADIKHMSSLTVEGFGEYGEAVRDSLNQIALCGRPTIAAIDGLALGGGLELAMACTLRFATPRSRLGLPEVKLGLIPGAGGTQRLPRLVGRGRALEMLLSGRDVHGEEAARIGLVDRLVEGDVRAAARAFAAELAGYSSRAVAAILACVDAANLEPEEGLALEAAEVDRTFTEGEAREGIAAFVGKRTPTFK